MVSFNNNNPFEEMEKMFKQELDKALKYLLDHEMISMTWDPDAEDMVFYMTDEQRAMPLPDDWEDSL